MKLVLGLDQQSQGGGGVSGPVITINGTTGGVAIIGDHASITMSASEGTISARKWGSTPGGSEYGTGTNPTDYTAGDGGTLYATATVGGSDYSRSAPITYAAPVAAGGLADRNYATGSGNQTVDASTDFTGSDISYAVSTAISGVTIDAGTGVVTIPTGSDATGTITVTGTNSGGSDQTAFSVTIEAAGSFPVGWDASADLGTTGDYFVDAVSGSDGNNGLTVGTAFATIGHALTTGGGGATYRLIGNNVKYREKVSLVSGNSAADRTEILGYGTDKPIITGAEVLTGLTQCTSADAAVLGATLGVNGSPVYKATLAKSALVDPASGKIANLHEAGTRLSLALDWTGGDENDPDFQQNINDWLTADTTHTYDDSGTTRIDGYTLTSVTNNYTQAQIERMWIYGYAAGNRTYSSEITSFDTGTNKINLTNTTAAYGGADANADRFALFNALPNMSVGQWGYVENGSNWDIYVYPNNPANVTSEIEYSAREQIFAARGISNIRIEGIQGRQAAGAVSTFDGGFYEAKDLAAKANVTIQNCLIDGMLGAGLHGVIDTALVSDMDVKRCTITNVLGLRGVNLNGYPQVAPNENLTQFAYRAHIDRNHIERVEMSGIRGTALYDSVASHNLIKTCSRETHENKTNVYLQTYSFLWWGNRIIDTGGYLTWQESVPAGMFNYIEGDVRNGSGTNNRTVVDQNAGLTPADWVSPADPFTAPWGNNTLMPTKEVYGDTAQNGFSITEDSLTNDTAQYNVLNNVFHGWEVQDAPQLADWSNNWNTASDGTYDVSDTASNLDDTYAGAAFGDFRIREGAAIRSATGDDLTSIISALSSRYTFFTEWSRDAFGDTFTAATPPMGASVNFKWVNAAGSAPSDILTGDWSLATGGDAAEIDLTVAAITGALHIEYTTDDGTSWRTTGIGAAGGTVTITKNSDGTDFASATSYTFKLRAANLSGHSAVTAGKAQTSGTAAGFSAVWADFSGTGYLSRTAGIGGSTGVTQMLQAFTFRAPDFTSGNYIMGNSGSIDVPWQNSTGVGFILVDVKNESNVRTFYVGSNALSVDTDYLALASYNGTTGVGKMAVIDIATGTTYTPTPVMQLSGATMDFSLSNWVIGAQSLAGAFKFLGRLERVQQWLGVSPDVTTSGVQDLFYDSGTNALLSPSVAIGTYGTPPVSLVGAGLTTGTNGGSGGDFTVTGTITTV